jgi:hypothetical protein
VSGSSVLFTPLIVVIGEIPLIVRYRFPDPALRPPAPPPSASDTINKLGSEFVAPSPSQATQARAAGREDEGELSRNVVIFHDNVHAALRHVGDHTVPRQRTRIIFDLREPLVWLAAISQAFSSIQHHVDLEVCPISG